MTIYAYGDNKFDTDCVR